MKKTAPSPLARHTAPWMNNSGPPRDIMNPIYPRMGVGFIACPTADYGYYWAETFAN